MKDDLDLLIEDADKHTKPEMFRALVVPELSDEDYKKFTKAFCKSNHILPTFNPHWDLVLS
jgi:hypothetical protein